MLFRSAPLTLVYRSQDRESIHDWPAKIEYDDIRLTVEDRRERFVALLTSCHHGDIVCTSEEVRQRVEDEGLVVDEHHADRHVRDHRFPWAGGVPSDPEDHPGACRLALKRRGNARCATVSPD